jgi:hypothetical protein
MIIIILKRIQELLKDKFFIINLMEQIKFKKEKRM